MRKLVFRILLVALLGYTLASAEPMYGQSPSQYTDSEKSLKQLIEALQDAAASDDAKFRALAEPLYFAGHEAWFKDVFGAKLGTVASENYASGTIDLVGSMRAAFRKLAQDGYDKARVEKLDEPCKDGVLQSEIPVLYSRKKKVPFYSVRYWQSSRFRSLGFFIYADNGFRYVGHVDFGPAYDEPQQNLLRVKSDDQVRKLIYRPPPRYPLLARESRIQGTVRLQAIIGLDGAVRDLRLVSGNCWLAEASIAAVSQWRYEPTMLNGKPVEVSTTIDVVYTLSR